MGGRRGGSGARAAVVSLWLATAIVAIPRPSAAQEAQDAAETMAGAAAHAWCPEPEARQFDFWLGEWNVQNLNRPPQGEKWYETGTATNRVYAIVGGCGIVEHWRGYAFPSAGHIAGFSVRAWDPEASEWDLVLLWPVNAPPRFGNPKGTFHDGRGEFFNTFPGPNGDTLLSRLTFSDVTPTSFRWSNGVSSDGGETFASSWIMEATRRPADASGLWNGPSMTTDRCPAEEHRAFDGFLGEWLGTRVSAAGDSTAVRTRVVRILDGCAVMDQTRAEDGSWEAFEVRAFEPQIGRWVGYATASDRRGLQRREGGAEMDDMVLTDVEPAGGSYLRTRWHADGQALVRTRERSQSVEGPWRELDRTRFTRVPARGGDGP